MSLAMSTPSESSTTMPTASCPRFRCGYVHLATSRPVTNLNAPRRISWSFTSLSGCTAQANRRPLPYVPAMTAAWRAIDLRSGSPKVLMSPAYVAITFTSASGTGVDGTGTGPPW